MITFCVNVIITKHLRHLYNILSIGSNIWTIHNFKVNFFKNNKVSKYKLNSFCIDSLQIFRKAIYCWINLIESVQRRATNMVSAFRLFSYEDCLQRLNISKMKFRRIMGWLGRGLQISKLLRQIDSRLSICSPDFSKQKALHGQELKGDFSEDGFNRCSVEIVLLSKYNAMEQPTTQRGRTRTSTWMARDLYCKL